VAQNNGEFLADGLGVAACVQELSDDLVTPSHSAAKSHGLRHLTRLDEPSQRARADLKETGELPVRPRLL
jgi:hypothetical protein